MEHYKGLGDKTFERLGEQQFFWKPSEESNDIWILVKHISGNMLARFTDLFSTDGEAGRTRDLEFVNDQVTKDEVLKVWNTGWERMFSTLNSLAPGDLKREVSLKNKPIELADFLNQAILHYSYHVGQIVFIGKLAVGKDWEQLWGPKKNH